MRTLLPVLLAASAALATDADFNGRSDITANTKPWPRAWWVELNGVGSAREAVSPPTCVEDTPREG